MLKSCRSFAIALAAASVGLISGTSARAGLYTVHYTDGGSWNTVYAQGFSTSLSASPNPGLASGTPVYLNGFNFFKSGTADTASNIQLAIFNTMYPNTAGLSTSSSSFVGLSTNTIASTSALNLNDAIAFSFDSLPLSYNSDYSAVFVNVGSGGALTPVRVSSLTANYAVQGDGQFHPLTNYGTESQFQYTTSNFINNGFFSAFNFAGDANFSASLNTVPEPAMMGLLGFSLLALRRRRAH